jgi:hypothetical protein
MIGWLACSKDDFDASSQATVHTAAVGTTTVGLNEAGLLAMSCTALFTSQWLSIRVSHPS